MEAALCLLPWVSTKWRLRREASVRTRRVINFLKRLEPLPEMEGDAGLLRLVFFNLRSRATKSSRTRQPGLIEAGACRANATTVYCVGGAGLDAKCKLLGFWAAP
jgi:hypothetical protein